MTPLRFVSVLRALCFALPILALAPPVAAQDFPRLGLYWSVHRDGQPLLHEDGTLDDAIASQVSRYHEIIVDVDPFSPYRPDVLLELRQRHPGIKLLGYVTGHFIWFSDDLDSLNHYPTRYWRTVRDLDGFLYNRSGAQFGLTNSAFANVNLAKKNAFGNYAVAESLASLFWDAVLKTGSWDGMFIDTFCDDMLWAQAPGESIDFVRAGYASSADFAVGWRAGTDTLASKLRRLCGPLPIITGGCATDSKYAWMNGSLRENFPLQNGGTWYSNMLVDPRGYLADDPKYRTPPNNVLFSAAGDLNDAYDLENMRQVRLGLGSAALGEGYGVFGNSARVGDAYHYWTWWYDEYAVDLTNGRSSTLQQHIGWLGQAIGPYYQMLWVGTNPDLVTNPEFETDLAGWTGVFHVGGSVSHDATTAGSGSASLRALVQTASTVDWHSHVTTNATLPILGGAEYSATFWAKASTPRSIAVVANDPVTRVGGRAYVTLGTEWRRYQVAIVPNGNGNAKLQFYLGLDAGEVWLDDVHFQRGTSTLYRRDFENGSVLVNPGSTDQSVPLEAGFRRILGLRDTAVNNGADVTTLVVPRRDARFLIAIAPDTTPPSTIQDATVRP